MRSYLTANELNFIVEEMKNHQDNALEREVLKVGITAQFVMDEEELGEYDGCDDIYDKLAKDGVEFEEFVTNYYLIDLLYAEDTNIKHDIKDFLDTVESKLDASFKKLPKDLKNFKFEDLLSMIKKEVDE